MLGISVHKKIIMYKEYEPYGHSQQETDRTDKIIMIGKKNVEILR
jgi:hypothetical protein